MTTAIGVWTSCCHAPLYVAWKSLPAAAFLDWFGQNNYFIMRAIPVVVIPTLVGLAGSLWLGWGDQTARNLWLAASGCVVSLS